MPYAPAFRRASRSTGFSLIELMVAVVIGLIGTVVIFQVFAVFEGQKRTQTSAGDAQQNGLLAVVNVGRDARLAGYGLSYIPLLGCNVVAYDTTGPRNFTFWLAPVQIADGAAGAPDTLTFSYANTGQLIAPAKIVTNASAGSTLTIVDSYYGFNVNDLVVAGNAGPSPLPNCTMRQITATPASAPPSAQPGELDYTGGVRFNGPAGLAAAYPAWAPTTQTGGRVYDLGPAPPSASAPVVGIYSVLNGQLLYQNLISDAAATPIVDGIVQLQAQYGLDDNGDGTIQTTEWRNGCAAPVAPASPQLPKGAAPGVCANPTTTDWSHVIAVRFAVLARSAQPEIPSTGTGTPCDTTTATPTWSGGNIDPSVVDPTSWKCYRYRVFETTVPVRNFIWSPQ